MYIQKRTYENYPFVTMRDSLKYLLAEGTKYPRTQQRTYENYPFVIMLLVRQFKITYWLKEPNSVSMYIQQRTYKNYPFVIMLLVRQLKITYWLKEPNSVSMYIQQRTYENYPFVIMLLVRQFKITYKLKEPYSVSMYVHTEVGIQEKSICDNALSEIVYNLLTEGTQFSIHVHTAADI